MPVAVRRRMLICGLTALGVSTLGVVGSMPAGTSAATPPEFPTQITAANGTITISSRPTAIVSLSATATEMLYAIGAGRQVKAVDTYSDYPKNAPRTDLNGFTPNVEAIVAYKPDLVIVAGDTSGLTAQLAKFGIPVLSEPAAASLSEEYQQIDQLGAATGHVDHAHAEVRHIRTDLAQIVRSAPKHAKSLTYYYELSPGNYSATSSTFVGQVFGLLGLHNIADAAPGSAASGGYPQLSSEFIIKANPDFIFLADTVYYKQSAKTVAERPGWAVLSAVKHGHVIALNDDIATRWGPRVVVLLQDIANALKPGTK
jgi:iron complex transport system substrate-binding protein